MARAVFYPMRQAHVGPVLLGLEQRHALGQGLFAHLRGDRHGPDFLLLAGFKLLYVPLCRRPVWKFTTDYVSVSTTIYSLDKEEITISVPILNDVEINPFSPVPFFWNSNLSRPNLSPAPGLLAKQLLGHGRQHLVIKADHAFAAHLKIYSSKLCQVQASVVFLNHFFSQVFADVCF